MLGKAAMDDEHLGGGVAGRASENLVSRLAVGTA